MRRRQAVHLLIGISVIGVWAGCGPGGISTTLPSQPSNPVSILFLVPPPSSLAINASTTIAASVQNDSSNPQIAWSVTCGSAGSCGSFSASSTPNQAFTTYTAPSAIPSGTTVTVTATLVGDPTVTISLPNHHTAAADCRHFRIRAAGFPANQFNGADQCEDHQRHFRKPSSAVDGLLRQFPLWLLQPRHHNQ